MVSISLIFYTLRPTSKRLLAAAALRWLSAESNAAHGFHAPGESHVSVEMQQAGHPEEVRFHEEAMRMHMFSEKDRLDPRSDAGKPGDTGGDRAIGPETMRLAEESAKTMEDPQALSNEPIPLTPDEVAPEYTKGAAPMDFGAREGGKGGPGKIEANPAHVPPSAAAKQRAAEMAAEKEEEEEEPPHVPDYSR